MERSAASPWWREDSQFSSTRSLRRSFRDSAHYPDAKLVRALEDEATIRLVQDGDREALGRLFEKYSRLVLRIALRVLRDPADAQDLLQDVFIYIQRRSFVFDPSKGTVFSWVFQVALSKATNRRKRLAARNAIYGFPVQGLTRLRDREGNADTLITKLAAETAVREGLGGLAEDQRDTLRMVFFDGYTLREISQKRNENLGNTRHHYYRGLAALRLLLKSVDCPVATKHFQVNRRHRL